MLELDIKKAERQRIDAFELWCWRTPLTLLDGDATAFLRTAANDPTVGILCYDEEEPALAGKGAVLFPVGPCNDLTAQAHRLFAALREADDHPALQKLYAHLPPQSGVGLALYNRLIRAAAHTVLKV